MRDLNESALTFYNGRVLVRKGLVEKKLDCVRCFLLQRLRTNVSIAKKQIRKALLLHETCLSVY